MSLPIGYKPLLIILLLLGACHTTENNEEPTPAVAEIPPPVTIPYVLVNSYPHDPKAYTQGLIWHRGYLVEGTGKETESNVRTVDLKTGKVIKQVKNEDTVFGEGITILNNKLYQLSWKNGKVFVYDANGFKKLQEFPLKTEGWGLTNNGLELIVSDGTSNLYFYDPNLFTEKRRVNVYDNMGPRQMINELEFINGFVYANIYETDFIIKIDPQTGRIVGRVDLSDLRSKADIMPMQMRVSENDPEVLNGIAFDSSSNRLFITGKYWPKLLEIKLDY